MNLFCSLKLWKVAAFGGLALANVSHRAEAQTPNTQPLPEFHHEAQISIFQPSHPATLNQPFTQPGTQTLPPSPAPRSFQPPAPPPVTPEQALAFLRLDLAQLVLKSPLTLKIENASLEKIAAQVQTALVENKVTPKMKSQVREPRPVLLSFVAKDSTVGEVLRSSGNLAGVQLWVFSDHFLLASEQSLLPEERKAVADGSAFKAPSRAWDRMSIIRTQQAALSSFIATEIKGLSAGKAGEQQTGKVTSNQLSPESKAMLQVLLDGTKDWFSQNRGMGGPMSGVLAGFDLSSNPTVDLIPSENGPTVQIAFSNGEASWSTWGNTSGVGTRSSSSRPSAPARLTPPVLDPSAGKS